MISIVIPTYNEAACIEQCIERLNAISACSSHEVIVSDGGSTDETVAISKKYASVVHAPKGRAIQMNAAARCASGDILFFVHADMEVPVSALDKIEESLYEKGFAGGGFSNEFSWFNRKIKLLGRILNFRLFDNDQINNLIFFGDNGIFCKRSAFNALRGFKEIPIMEDFDFSRRLMKNYRVVRIQEPRLVVSSRRHEHTGFMRTRLLWILVRKFYLMGVSPFILAKWYKDHR